MEANQDQKVEKRYKEALLAYEQKEFHTALEIFSEILALDPHYKRAPRYAQACEKALREETDSESTSQETIPEREILQSYSDALDFLQKQHFEEAIDRFEAIQLADPDFRSKRIAELLSEARQGLGEDSLPAAMESSGSDQDEEASTTQSLSIANIPLPSSAPPILQAVQPQETVQEGLPDSTQRMNIFPPKRSKKLPLLVLAGTGCVMLLLFLGTRVIIQKRKIPKETDFPIPMVHHERPQPTPIPSDTPLPTQNPREILIQEFLSASRSKLDQGDLDPAKDLLLSSLSKEELKREDVMSLLHAIEGRKISLDKDRRNKEKAEQREYMLRDTRKAMESGDWKQTAFLAQRILDLYGEHEETRTFLNSAKEKLAVEERKELYKKEISQARLAIQDKDPLAADLHVTNARNLFGETQDVKNLELDIQGLKEEIAKLDLIESDSTEESSSKTGSSLFSSRKIKRLERKATEQHQAGHIEEAVETIKELLALDPQNGVGRTIQGLIEKDRQAE